MDKKVKTGKKPAGQQSVSSEPKKPRTDFLFDRGKYKILIIGLFVTALGFILMVGGGSDDPYVFREDIFNFRRLTLAPFLVLLGYGIQIYSILKSKKA